MGEKFEIHEKVGDLFRVVKASQERVEFVAFKELNTLGQRETTKNTTIDV